MPGIEPGSKNVRDKLLQSCFILKFSAMRIRDEQKTRITYPVSFRPFRRESKRLNPLR